MKDYKEYAGKEVTIMLCSSCNVNCRHCYISYEGDRNIKELSKMIYNLKNKGYEIDLNGAEPLINLQYLQFYKMTNSKSIMTNGLGIYQNPHIIELLKENNITTVEISHHFSLHDQISPIPLNIVEDVIKLCIDNGIKILINTTISKKNYMEIKSICEKAYELGASRIRFNNFINQGQAIQNNLKNFILNSEQISTFFLELKRVREQYNKNDLYIERSGLFGKDTLGIKSNFNCPAGTDDITITPDNLVYPCFFIAKKGFEIGKYEDGIIKIFKEFKCNRQEECFACKKLNFK